MTVENVSACLRALNHNVCNFWTDLSLLLRTSLILDSIQNLNMFYFFNRKIESKSGLLAPLTDGKSL